MAKIKKMYSRLQIYKIKGNAKQPHVCIYPTPQTKQDAT